jgi:4-amino-4-deoxy-L-arabinose transferase-like glycosyltransferase
VRAFRFSGIVHPSQRHIPILLIMGVAVALRLLYITAPLLDAHRWRQVDTASIARTFYEERFNPLRPEANWGGAHGAVESEFPLLPMLAALLYSVFGPDEMWGRLIVVVFSVGSVWLTYVLGTQLLDDAGGLAAATLVAVSPAAVFYGRAFMPDSLMICFSLAALVGFVRHATTGATRPLVVASVALGLTILVKLPGILVLAPVAAVLWHVRGRQALGDRRLWLAVAVPVAVAAAWYWHAYQIYLETGLTFGVIGTTKTYPAFVATSEWTTAFSKWSSVELLTTTPLYDLMLSRLYFLHLTPPGFALALVGLVLWRAKKWRVVVDAWLAAMVAFILVAGAGHMGHDYYQLPLVPIFALYFAAAAWPVFAAGWIATNVGPGLAPRLGVALVVAAVAAMSFWHSGVIARHFRPAAPDVRILRAGEAIQRGVGEAGLIVAVDDYGVNSPMLLYFAHAKGWSFDAETLTASVVRTLEPQGARYFASTRWSAVRRRQPDLAAYLQTRHEVVLVDAPADTVLFDLRRPR